MNTNDILLLCDYNRWANERLFEAVSVLSKEQLNKDLNSSHHSVRETLYHILLGEWLWLMRCKGISPKTVPELDEFPDLQALKSRWTSIEMDQYNFLSKISDESLQEVVEYQYLNGEEAELPLWVMIHHTVNHSTHHRGQVTTMLRQLGAPAAELDFTLFLKSKPVPA
jgi:uncharacterized damage-inducible protein DinB